MCKVFTRALTAMLAVLMLPVFTACGNSDDASKSDGTATETADTIAAENLDPYAAYVAGLPEINYDGWEFVILTRSKADNPSWYTYDVWVEAADGEVINDAVYERNLMMEEKIGVKVVAREAGKLPYEAARPLILAGEESFAAVTDGMTYLANLAVEKLLVDYNEMNGIELENEWWDQNMVRDMSIAHRLYFVTGDISVMDNEGTWALTFNKQLQQDFGLADYYEYRDNGTWTLDKLATDVRKVAADLNGDGKIIPGEDRYGFNSEVFNIYALWAGGGNYSVTKNEDDLPEYSLYNERSASFMEEVLALQTDTNVVLHGAELRTTYPILSSMSICTGDFLFELGGMKRLRTSRRHDGEFGVLPLPKYTEEQDRYYSVSSFSNMTAYSVPVTTSDIERTATTLEVMAGLSYYTLSPAYYDISLTSKYLRDEESSASIDIILANRSYDLGIIFNWGNSLTMIMSLGKNANFASRCASIEPTINKEIEKFVNRII